MAEQETGPERKGEAGAVAEVSSHDGSRPDALTGVDVRRRAALVKLGLTVAVAYAAPTILHLDRSAKAQILPSCEPPPGGGDCETP